MRANYILFFVYFAVPVTVVSEKSLFNFIFGVPAAKNFLDAFRENGSYQQALESLDEVFEMTDGLLQFLESKVK